MARPARVADIRKITYDEKRWNTLKELRKRALELMLPLESSGFSPIVHGSVARGDVDRKSDVDVVIPYVIPSYQLEIILLKADLAPVKREIVMATPWQLPKAHIYIEDDRSVKFPLVKPRQTELEFYRFGGAASADELRKNIRVPGVDKRLMLIEPKKWGHLEGPVLGDESAVAKKLGVGLEIIRERVQVLTRRVRVGHTGIFIRRELAPGENFEEALRRLMRENPEMKIGLKGRLP
ncbi:MAG: nucleotidyltransferase domain-containing protein [Candidatus Hadarchaeaceae archaeon]